MNEPKLTWDEFHNDSPVIKVSDPTTESTHPPITARDNYCRGCGTEFRCEDNYCPKCGQERSSFCGRN